MAIARLTQEHAVDMITKGLEVTLEYEIKAKVKEFRDQIVKEIDDALEAACKSAAEKVVGKVAEYQNLANCAPELHIHFGFKDKKHG